jgi:AraC-like DNA-binding protein
MTEFPNRLPQRPNALQAGAMQGSDVLSDVLRTVRLSGSMLFLVQASTPWRSHAPQTALFAHHVLPSAQHLISYHLVVRGSCWGGLLGAPAQPLCEGDVLVVPHGDAYALASPRDAAPAYSDDEAVEFFRGMAAGEIAPVVNEGGAGDERTEFICGFLGCDARPFNPILWALPRWIHLRRVMQAGDRLSHLLAYALSELRAPSAGGRDVLLRLSELMFVEVVRRQLSDAPADQGGWLAALRDPLVSRVLARMHAQPARAWTLEALSAHSGASRSTLAEHFAQVVGQPPMQYLAGWRMQLATRLLADSGAKVRAVAEAVGYSSEAAFSRAFKKHAGLAPNAWRQRASCAPAALASGHADRSTVPP